MLVSTGVHVASPSPSLQFDRPKNAISKGTCLTTVQRYKSHAFRLSHFHSHPLGKTVIRDTRTFAMWSTLGTGLAPILGAMDHLLKPIKFKPHPIKLPRQQPVQPETPIPEVDAKINKLAAASKRWVATSCAERAVLMRKCLDCAMQVAPEMAAAGTLAKGSYGAANGEEFCGLLSIVFGLKEYVEAMEAGGAPAPVSLKKRQLISDPSQSQYVAQVFPAGIVGVLFSGFNGEVWLQPGAEPSQGRVYAAKREDKASGGGVCLVLGAGNQITVPIMDILHMLMAEDCVCLLKMNPVNDYAGPLIQKMLQPLVEAGCLQLVYGGAKVGQHAVQHKGITRVHLTGSEATYNAIVWGSAQVPPAGEPLAKPVTAELGNVTPYIVVPGRWSAAEIDHHAENIVAGKVHNAGHNCIALEVLITAKGWSQREELVAAIKRKLNSLPQRGHYYPGSAAKIAAYKQAIPGAQEYGVPVTDPETGAKSEPYLAAFGLSPEEAVTEVENWAGVMQEVALPGGEDDVEKFMADAVAFANDRCKGTLAAAMFIHPATQRKHEAAFNKALEELRYGNIAVNVPTIVSFPVSALPWGAYGAGGTPRDIGSGCGHVHNTFMYDHVQKGVLRAPFVYRPKPFWWPSNTNTEVVAERSMEFIEAALNSNLRGLINVSKVAWADLRG